MVAVSSVSGERLGATVVATDQALVRTDRTRQPSRRWPEGPSARGCGERRQPIGPEHGRPPQGLSRLRLFGDSAIHHHGVL